jgi:GTP-binding protein Era
MNDKDNNPIESEDIIPESEPETDPDTTQPEAPLDTKAGYVAIIGMPNSGKSTLLNSILGTKLSIATHKPQTTRKNVLGIHSEKDFQIVFLDTPGLLRPKYSMQENMMGYVQKSVEDADLLVIVIDIEKWNGYEAYFSNAILKRVLESRLPKVAFLNKIDTKKDVKDTLPIIKELSEKGDFAEIVPGAAIKQHGQKELIDTIGKHLPASPFFYDPELLSTQPERFFVSELIREQVFLLYKDEIPYSTEVNIVEFKEREDGKWFISAEIIIERDSQKIIVIGKRGAMLKQLGMRSRKEIEAHLDQSVYLSLFVKVRNKWRDNNTYLRSYGY